MAQTERVTAIVLDRVPYQEHDRLYTLLTVERGLVRARARGASKPKAKVRPHVEGFGIVDAMIVHGRAGYLLVSAEMIEPIRIKSLEAQLLADSARRTLAKIMREEENNGKVFALLFSLLKDLTSHQSPSTNHRLAARELHFYWSLLGELGYNGSLEKCSACQKALAGEANFIPMAGAFFCEACSKGVGVIVSKELRDFLSSPFTNHQPPTTALSAFSNALAEHFHHRLDIAYPSIFR